LTAVTAIVKVCAALVSVRAVGREPDLTVATAVGIGGRRVGQRAGGRDRRLLENSGVLSFETISSPSDSLVGRSGAVALAQLATVCGGASSRTLWDAPLVKLGVTLIAVTVIVNVCARLVSRRAVVRAAIPTPARPADRALDATAYDSVPLGVPTAASRRSRCCCS